MKLRVTLLALFTLVFYAAQAQTSKNVLEIDQSSFRPVQTDIMSGVAIDKIGTDRSKRPCARIKMHINRMTREDIEQIVIRPVGGMVELTKKMVASEGNGLIIEITAKPQTRFYIHHEKYGDSNEVIVNLDANKEYRIDAQLNLLLSITVASNVKGADVYIDNVFKGQIKDDYLLTVEDVIPGKHVISLKYGASSSEQTVDVNSSNVAFRVEVNSQSSRPQYVIFELEPKYSTVFIDNEPQVTQEGYVTAVLQNGTYSYRVVAKGYFEQSGTFTVSGEKVVRNISLVPDAAIVSISSGDGMEIWVNNEFKGISPWRGQLLSGTYIFEARKAGHRTTVLTQSISSSQTEQKYVIESPTPIIGYLNITSVPAVADIYLDGKKVGQTPLLVDALEGEHSIKVTKTGYRAFELTTKVTEGNTTDVVASMPKGDSSSSLPIQTAKGNLLALSAHAATWYGNWAFYSNNSGNGQVNKAANRLWGYKSKDSKQVLPYEYKRMVLTDYIYARKDKKSTWGVYDLKGNLIVPHIYKDIVTCEGEGLWAVRKGNKWGYVDAYGNTVVDFKYKEAKVFSQGLAAVKKGSKYGFIDRTDNRVVDFKYRTADGFYDGMARVGKQAGHGWWLTCLVLGPYGIEIALLMRSSEIKYGYISRTGELVIPQDYKSAPLFFDSDGIAKVAYKKHNKNAFYIDRNNNIYESKEDALKAKSSLKR